MEMSLSSINGIPPSMSTSSCSGEHDVIQHGLFEVNSVHGKNVIPTTTPMQQWSTRTLLACSSECVKMKLAGCVALCFTKDDRVCRLYTTRLTGSSLTTSDVNARYLEIPLPAVLPQCRPLGECTSFRADAAFRLVNGTIALVKGSDIFYYETIIDICNGAWNWELGNKLDSIVPDEPGPSAIVSPPDNNTILYMAKGNDIFCFHYDPTTGTYIWPCPGWSTDKLDRTVALGNFEGGADTILFINGSIYAVKGDDVSDESGMIWKWENPANPIPNLPQNLRSTAPGDAANEILVFDSSDMFYIYNINTATYTLVGDVCEK